MNFRWEVASQPQKMVNSSMTLLRNGSPGRGRPWLRGVGTDGPGSQVALPRATYRVLRATLYERPALTFILCRVWIRLQLFNYFRFLRKCRKPESYPDICQGPEFTKR